MDGPNNPARPQAAAKGLLSGLTKKKKAKSKAAPRKTEQTASWNLDVESKIPVLLRLG